MCRVLLVESTLAEIKASLTRLSHSVHIRTFAREISAFIHQRIRKIEILYHLKLNVEVVIGMVAVLTSELASKEDCILEVSIDQLLLCFTYAVYKLNKEKVLLAKIISVYEREMETRVDAGNLLRFYNEVYIMHDVFQGNMSDAKIDYSRDLDKILGNSIMEEKSILEMFE